MTGIRLSTFRTVVAFLLLVQLVDALTFVAFAVLAPSWLSPWLPTIELHPLVAAGLASAGIAGAIAPKLILCAVIGALGLPGSPWYVELSPRWRLVGALAAIAGILTAATGASFNLHSLFLAWWVS